MDSQEAKQLNLFREEIKKYDVLDGTTASLLLYRYISPLHKKRFFNEQLKMRYYASYWFKILVREGTLIQTGLGYKINKRQ
jgi:hypothetical protein